MFTVLITVRNFYVLVIFSFLPSETTEAYLTVMNQLAPNMINVTIVFADFEQSMQSAVSSSWSWTRIRGYRFHLAQ